MKIQLEKEFSQLMRKENSVPLERRMTLACREQEHGFLWELAMQAMNYFPGLDITVIGVPFKGATATQEEISKCLCYDDLGEELLLLDNLLGSDDFLENLEFDLEVIVNKTQYTGRELLFALIAKDNRFDNEC